MKVSKKRAQKWKDILPLLEAERGASASPVFIDAMDACFAIIGGEDPNYLIYNTTDIIKTNALMECADIIRDYSRESIKDYREE